MEIRVKKEILVLKAIQGNKESKALKGIRETPENRVFLGLMAFQELMVRMAKTEKVWSTTGLVRSLGLSKRVIPLMPTLT